MGRITRIAGGTPEGLVDFARERIFRPASGITARGVDAAPLSLERVLQRLHDSGINAGLQSFCFTGLTAWIGDPRNGQEIEADLSPEKPGWGLDGSVAQWLHETALRLYPDSEYARLHAGARDGD
jgi:hypothetical protein